MSTYPLAFTTQESWEGSVMRFGTFNDGFVASFSRQKRIYVYMYLYMYIYIGINKCIAILYEYNDIHVSFLCVLVSIA